MLRSARLEALFGKRLDKITYDDVFALIGNPDATEEADLDYKQLVHTKNEEQKTEFCKDILAMGNGLGGVIFIGVAEDSQSVPGTVPGVEVSDKERGRLISLAASHATPHLPIDIKALEDPARAGLGVLMVRVERSLEAPHALLGPNAKEGFLRYPIRNGASTRWMLEPEVATRYRDRFAERGNLQTRLDNVEDEAVWDYDEREERQNRTPKDSQTPARPVMAVSLVPELAGRMTISSETFKEFQQYSAVNRPVIGTDFSFQQAFVASGRFVAVGGAPVVAFYEELHIDGAGCFIWALPEGEGDEVPLHLPTILRVLLSGLKHLGEHARDRAGASGIALLRLRLVGGVYEMPNAGPLPVGTRGVLRQGSPGLRVTGDHPYRGTTSIGSDSATIATGQANALVDNLADAGSELVAAASLLADETFQTFGLPDVAQLNTQGQLNPDSWGTEWSHLDEWAKASGLA